MITPRSWDPSQHVAAQDGRRWVGGALGASSRYLFARPLSVDAEDWQVIPIAHTCRSLFFMSDALASSVDAWVAPQRFTDVTLTCFFFFLSKPSLLLLDCYVLFLSCGQRVRNVQLEAAAHGNKQSKELLEAVYRELSVLGIVAFVLWSISFSPDLKLSVRVPSPPLRPSRLG